MPGSTGLINKKRSELATWEKALAVTSNIYIDQGSEYTSIITVSGPDSAPLNLTDFTVQSQMRKSYGSSTAYSFTATIHNALAGQIKLYLTTADSEIIPAGRWLYDVEIAGADGYRKRVVEGVATITPQITRTTGS